MTRINFVDILLFKDKQDEAELPLPDRSSLITQPGPNRTIRWEEQL